MFIGRTRELTELNRLYHSTRFQMAVIYGRRRIGKTRIIQEFIKDKKAVYMMAVESNLPANLELLSTAIYNAFQGETEAAAMPPFQSLENAFHYLTQKARQQKIIFVIDEYPYLAQAEKSVSSLLQSLIDQQWKQMNFMVILCGSSMSFMENQILGYKSPLYGRRTAQFLIKPMDYSESSLFVPEDVYKRQSMTSFAATGWVEEDGTWVYYNRDEERATEEWKKSGDNWFWLDDNGEMAVDQLIEDDDDYYYVNEAGAMVTNQWVAIENEDVYKRQASIS